MINELRYSKKTTDKYAPQKKGKIRGNQPAVMVKEPSKQIMKRSKSKTLYLKWPSWENFLAYKNLKNTNATT